MYFESVSVYPAYSNEIVVEWELAEATKPGVYTFEVYRAGSPEGPFELLTPVPLVDSLYYVDQDIALTTKENQVYYQVKVTGPDGKVVLSAPKDMLRNLEKRQWLILREIARKEIRRFRKKVGLLAYVLKRKHFGQRCKICTDPVGGQSTVSFCRDCFGTKFCGGFHDPIEAWVEVAPIMNDKALRPDGLGMAENFTTQIRLVSYPLVTRGDLLIEAESNRRFHVRSVQPFELRTVPVVQTVTVSQISRSDVEYLIPLDTIIVP